MMRALVLVVLLAAVASGVVLAGPYLVPPRAIEPYLETWLAAQLGRPLVIGELIRFRWLPRLSVHARDVRLPGADGDPGVAAQSVHASAPAFGWLRQGWRLEHVGVEGLEMRASTLRALLDAAPRSGQALIPRSLSIGGLVLSGVGGRELGPYALSARLDARGDPLRVRLERHDGALSVELLRLDGRRSVQVRARAWRTPTNPPITLTALDARGVLDARRLALEEITGEVHGGAFGGELWLAWGERVTLEARLDASDVGLRHPLLQGRLSGRGHAILHASRVEALLENPVVQADFRIRSGRLRQAEFAAALARSTRAPAVALDGTTVPFARLTGRLVLLHGRIRLTDLALSSTDLGSLRGELELDRRGRVEGVLHVEPPQERARDAANTLRVRGDVSHLWVRSVEETSLGAASASTPASQGADPASGSPGADQPSEN